jgi:hypothetical protein
MDRTGATKDVPLQSQAKVLGKEVVDVSAATPGVVSEKPVAFPAGRGVSTKEIELPFIRPIEFLNWCWRGYYFFRGYDGFSSKSRYGL